MARHQGYLRANHRLVTLLQKLIDPLLIGLAFFLSYRFYVGSWDVIPPSYWTIVMIAATTYYISGVNTNLYQSWRSDQLLSHLTRMLRVWAITVGILIFMAWALKVTHVYSRVVLGLWIVAVPTLLCIERWIVRFILNHFRGQGRNVKYIAIVGDSLSAKALIDEVNNNKWMGYVVKGLYAEHWQVERSEDVSKGNYQQLIVDVKDRNFDEVFIALPMHEEQQISSLVMELSDSSLPVHIIPDLFTFNLLNARVSRIGNIPAISIFDTPHDDLSAFTKRCEDVLLSILILTIISPVMLFIASDIKLTSKGPVLYKQQRYGIGGEKIVVWKFRSMTVCDSGDIIKQASKNDSRITPLGVFLRRTSLDELPQFINVLQGRMSIVGPRPHAVAHNEQYRKSIHGYMLRHLVKPGITGWAQINGWRGETDTMDKMEKRIEYDLQYIQNWSIFFDLKIIVLTIFKGFINKNAY